MPSNYKREVPIDLDRRRLLRFSANAMIISERELGKPFEEILMELGKCEALSIEERIRFARRIVTWEVLRAMIWAGLLHENRNLTQEQVGDWMDEAQEGDSDRQFKYFWDKIMEAWAATKGPEAKKNILEALERTRDLQAQTGDSSSSLQASTASPSISSGE